LDGFCSMFDERNLRFDVGSEIQLVPQVSIGWWRYELCTPLVRGRRKFDVESWGAKYFFTVDFLMNPLKLCDVNSSNTWVLIVFIKKNRVKK
jgi:hypothetical protein